MKLTCTYRYSTGQTELTAKQLAGWLDSWIERCIRDGSLEPHAMEMAKAGRIANRGSWGDLTPWDAVATDFGKRINNSQPD